MQAEVHLELIEMEKTILVPGGTCNKPSATSLLMAAFDIEDAQEHFLAVQMRKLLLMLHAIVVYA
jgi:hypothetical protein